ncbi:MAG TPA: hypothetical protein VGD84_24185 [Pseudonocardiaceae bacterium]
MTDWTAISNAATGGGTLVLALATFASVRSSNRSARIAEHALMVGTRPVLVPSRFEDRSEKIFWADGHFQRLRGGRVSAKIENDYVYLAMTLRNVGNGIGVLRGWRLEKYVPGILPAEEVPLEEFRDHSRDMYVPAGDMSFWQAAIRDSNEDHYEIARVAIEAHEPFIVHVLYTDHEGRQRTVSRFAALPLQGGEWKSDNAEQHEDGPQWLSSVSRHWFLDNGNGQVSRTPGR